MHRTESSPFGSSLFYALFIPYVYITIYANFHGIPTSTSNYLLPILNAMNIPSRILPGILADRYGPYVHFPPFRRSEHADVSVSR